MEPASASAQNHTLSPFASLILKAARHALEAAQGLLQHPLHGAPAVVAMRQNPVASGEAMGGAILLHFVELFHVKLVMAHRAPIVGRSEEHTSELQSPMY